MQAFQNENEKIRNEKSKWRNPPLADDFINCASFDFAQSPFGYAQGKLCRTGHALQFDS